MKIRRQNKILIIALSTLLLLSIFVGIASAVTTTLIDFEYKQISGWELIGNPYSGLGVTFDSDTYLLDKDSSSAPNRPSGRNSIFDLSSGVTRIDFNPPVSRLKIWYNAAYTTSYMDAYDINGAPINSVSGQMNSDCSWVYPGWSCTINGWDPLEIASSSTNIAFVVLHDSGNKIEYDNLEFDRPDASVPEFPTMLLPIAAVIGLMFLFQRRKGK